MKVARGRHSMGRMVLALDAFARAVGVGILSPPRSDPEGASETVVGVPVQRGG
jgi:hypothetical protein